MDIFRRKARTFRATSDFSWLFWRVKSRKFLGRADRGAEAGFGHRTSARRPCSRGDRNSPLPAGTSAPLVRRAARGSNRRTGRRTGSIASLRCYFLQPRFRSNGGQPCDLEAHLDRGAHARAVPCNPARPERTRRSKRAAAEADAKRAYPTTPSGVALKNKISDERCRDPRSSRRGRTGHGWRPTRSSDVSLEALESCYVEIGTRLRVFWPLENAFFKGKVVAFRPVHDEAPRAVRGRGRGAAELFREARRGGQPPSGRRARRPPAAREGPSAAQSVFVSSKAAGKKKSNGSLAVKKKRGKETGGAKAATTPLDETVRVRAARTVGDMVSAFKVGARGTRRARPPRRTRSGRTRSRRTRCRDTHEGSKPRRNHRRSPSRTPSRRLRRFCPRSREVAVPERLSPARRYLRRIEDRHNLERRGSRAAAPRRRAACGPSTSWRPCTRRGKRTRAGRPQGEEGRRPRGARSGRGARILRCGSEVRRNGTNSRAFDPPSEFGAARTIEGVETQTTEAETRRWHAFRAARRSRRGPRRRETRRRRLGTAPAPTYADVLEEAEAASHRPAMQPHMKLSEEEAWACHSEVGLGTPGPGSGAGRVGMLRGSGMREMEAVPAVVARADEASDARWRRSSTRATRDSRGCDAPQELPSDDIDERVALTSRAEEKRERKRHLDREYRIRKRARVLEDDGARKPLGVRGRRGGSASTVAVILLVVGGRGRRRHAHDRVPGAAARGRRSAYARRAQRAPSVRAERRGRRRRGACEDG